MTDAGPLYYLSGRTINRRPVTRKEDGKSIIAIGFPVCTVSEYVDPELVLALFNEHTT